MSAGRTAAVVLTALILQVCLFARFSFEGARPDVMLLLAVMAGYVLGPERGAVVGFASGLAFDVVLSTPLGLSALVYTLVGWGVGAVTGGLVRSAPWIGPAVAAAGSAVGVLVWALLGAVVGEPTFEGPPLAAIVVLVAAVNVAVAPLAVRALRWTRVDEPDRRHALFSR